MLQLATDNARLDLEFSSQIKEEHHNFLIEGYLSSHLIRNHSERTIEKEKAFLHRWFKQHSMHGCTWEFMNITNGRQTINDYSKGLLKTGVASQTIRSQLGTLSRYFSYVLDHPYVKIDDAFVSIIKLYGPIDQPISEYDIPVHSYNGEQRGIPLDPELLYSFFHCLRSHYLIFDNSMSAATRARNYAMAVVAAESGLRADELLHLEVSDLFWQSKKLQTRHAKGTKGSGKRARVTLFTPLARDTLTFYLKKYRGVIACKDNKYLFPNKRGEPLNYVGARNSLREMIYVAQEKDIPILDHMSWHWFRRIFATRFIEKFPHQLSILVELLGHTSTNTVHRYIKHSDAWIDQKIQDILEDNL